MAAGPLGVDGPQMHVAAPRTGDGDCGAGGRGTAAADVGPHAIVAVDAHSLDPVLILGDRGITGIIPAQRNRTTAQRRAQPRRRIWRPRRRGGGLIDRPPAGMGRRPGLQLDDAPPLPGHNNRSAGGGSVAVVYLDQGAICVPGPGLLDLIPIRVNRVIARVVPAQRNRTPGQRRPQPRRRIRHISGSHTIIDADPLGVDGLHPHIAALRSSNRNRMGDRRSTTAGNVRPGPVGASSTHRLDLVLILGDGVITFRADPAQRNRTPGQRRPQPRQRISRGLRRRRRSRSWR